MAHDVDESSIHLLWIFVVFTEDTLQTSSSYVAQLHETEKNERKQGLPRRRHCRVKGVICSRDKTKTRMEEEEKAKKNRRTQPVGQEKSRKATCIQSISKNKNVKSQCNTLLFCFDKLICGEQCVEYRYANWDLDWIWMPVEQSEFAILCCGLTKPVPVRRLWGSELLWPLCFRNMESSLDLDLDLDS